MTQMNLPTKQKQTHRHSELTYGCQGGGCWGWEELGAWDWQMPTIIYRMDKQGPTVWHRELYSICCDKP